MNTGVNRFEENDNLTQTTYNETPYEDQGWEVVGETPGDAVFIPQQFAVIRQEWVPTDPMFADYGGVQEATQGERWHLPEGVTPHAQQRSSARSASRSVGESLQQEPIQQGISEEQVAAMIQQARAEERAATTQELEHAFQQRMKEGEQRLNSVLQDLMGQIATELKRVEHSSVELALSISNKIVGAAVEVNPEYILPIIQEALELSGAATIKKIRISPDDYEFLTVLGFDKTLRKGDVSWDFERDETVRAGCVVETSAGQVDYRLDKAWDRIKDSILKIRR